jgi:hypothetical protein
LSYCFPWPDKSEQVKILAADAAHRADPTTMNRRKIADSRK